MIYSIFVHLPSSKTFYRLRMRVRVSFESKRFRGITRHVSILAQRIVIRYVQESVYIQVYREKIKINQMVNQPAS